MADEQVQMEMQEQLRKMQELQQLMQTNPQVAENPEVKGEMERLQLEVESRKAILIAEMMNDFLEEERKLAETLVMIQLQNLELESLILKLKII